MGKVEEIYVLTRSCFWSILLFCLFFSTPVLKADKDVSLIHIHDSLLVSLQNTKKPAYKINILRELIAMNRYIPQEAVYSEQLLEVAKQADSTEVCYEAIYFLSRYYSNVYELDSLRYWVDRIDSLTTARGETPPQLFSAHNALCRLYVIRGEYELAMNEAVKLQILAEKEKYTLGLAYCNENWGLIYMRTSRFKESAEAFENCLGILRNIKNQYLYELQIGECLNEVYLSLKEYQNAEKSLNNYEKIIDKIKASDSLVYRTSDTNEYEFILAIYRMRLYSEMNRKADAGKALASATGCIAKNNEILSLRYLLTGYNRAMASYCYMKKEYHQALDYITREIEMDESAFRLKVNTLLALGRKEEVLNSYRDYLEIKKEKKKQGYILQIDQLRTLQKMNEEDRDVQAVVVQEKELKNKHTQLIALSVFLSVLSISILVLFLYLIRTRRLKDALLEKQAILKDTNYNLNEAKERAERADRMKSNFIANISHEVRTPLNAIVGFTGLLEDASEEERSQYIQIIGNNSDLLLKLVSDVLDLSRMKGEDFIFSFQETNIQECCGHVLDTIRHRVNADVKLVFTPPQPPLIVSTDPYRLQQLLVNLLTNAAKFTEKGEIRLDYQVDEANGMIRFSVTDTGCGIPSDKQKIIFERFEKVDDFKQGAGLGLSICKAISECFEGRLYIDPAYTGGARFIFELPLRR